MANDNNINESLAANVMVGNLDASKGAGESLSFSDVPEDPQSKNEAIAAMSAILDAEAEINAELSKYSASEGIPAGLLEAKANLMALKTEVLQGKVGPGTFARIGGAYNGVHDAVDANKDNKTYMNATGMYSITSLNAKQQALHSQMVAANIGGFNEYGEASQALFVRDLDAAMADDPEFARSITNALNAKNNPEIQGIMSDEAKKNLSAIQEIEKALADGKIHPSQETQLRKALVQARENNTDDIVNTYNLNEVLDEYKSKLDNLPAGQSLSAEDSQAFTKDIVENVSKNTDAINKASATALGRLSIHELDALREHIAAGGDPANVSNEDVMRYLENQTSSPKKMDAAMDKVNSIIENNPDVKDLAGALEYMAQHPEKYKEDLLVIAVDRSIKNAEFQKVAADWNLFLEGVDGPPLAQLQRCLANGDKDMLVQLMERQLGENMTPEMRRSLQDMPASSLIAMMNDIKAGDVNAANTIFDANKVRTNYNFGDTQFFTDNASAKAFIENETNRDALARLAMTSGTNYKLLETTKFDMTGVSEEQQARLSTVYESLFKGGFKVDTNPENDLKLNMPGTGEAAPDESKTKPADANMADMLGGLKLSGVSGGQDIAPPPTGEGYPPPTSLPAQDVSSKSYAAGM